MAPWPTRRERTGRRCRLALLALLILGAVLPLQGAAAEDEQPRRERCLRFARVVTRFIEGGDLERLRSLERGIDPDPWLLAWILVQQGRADVARTFLRECACAELEGLAPHMARWTKAPANAQRLEAVVALEHAVDRVQDEAAVKAAEPLVEAEAPFVRALALLRAGIAHRRLRAHNQAAEALDAARRACDALGWLWGTDRAEQELGKLAFARLQPREALDALETVVARREKLGWHAPLATAYLDLGAVHGLLENYHGVLAYNAKAAPLLHPSFQREELFTAHMNAGTAHALLGDLAAALGSFEAARDVAAAMEQPARQSEAWIHIAWIRGRLGRLEAADRAQAKAAELAALATQPEAQTLVDAFTGGLRAMRARRSKDPQDWEAAVAAHARARTAFRRAERWDLAARAWLAQATARAWQGRHEEALTMLADVRARLDELGEAAGVVEADLLRGWIHMAADAVFEAEEAFDRALERARELALLHPEAVALHGRAAARAAVLDELADRPRRRRSEARRILADVTESVRIQRRLASGLSEEQVASARDGFAITPLGQDEDSRADLFELGLRMAHELGDAERMFGLVESSRALGFLESYTGLGALRRRGISATEREVEERVRREEALARFAFERARRRGNLQRIQSTTKALRAAMARTAERLADAERRAKALTDAIHPRAARVAEVQAALGPRDAFASFAVFADAIHVILVKPDGKPTLHALGPLAPVSQAAEALHAGIENHDAASKAAFDALGRLLVAPLGKAAGAGRLLISPDGPLHGVPFGALMAACEVTQVPSASAWLALRRKHAKPAQGVLGVGAPTYAPGRKLLALGNAKAELDALPGTDVVRLTAEKATVAGLLAKLPADDAPRLRILHLACHGIGDGEQPLASALELSADEAHGGSWRARDIMLARVPAELVVLSACRTGVGRSYRGEGLLGLPRAFLLAGGERVVASLWNVDDAATAAFMRAFYGQRAKGLSVAAALCAAQAAVKAEARWAHPYYWAAWVVWGREG